MVGIISVAVQARRDQTIWVNPRPRSLDLVPEDASVQKPVPPPPAPTLLSQFGVMLRRPPDCHYPKKGTAKNILSGPVKYGVLDAQLA